jgi:hypothetical protein
MCRKTWEITEAIIKPFRTLEIKLRKKVKFYLELCGKSLEEEKEAK